MLKRITVLIFLFQFSYALKAQSESEIFTDLFNFSSDITELSTNIISLSVDAVWLASDITGAATITGTLTQSASNPDYWTYTASPSDRLILIFSDNSRIEFTFTTIDGYVDGSADDFKDSHTMDFTAAIENSLSLRIVSNTGPNNGNIDWQRTITGNIIYNEVNLNLNIQHNGSKNYDIGSGYAFYDYTESASGSASGSGNSFTINDHFHTYIAHNSNDFQFAKDTQIWNNSSVETNGTTYAFSNVNVFWAGGTQSLEDAENNFYNSVLNDYQWSSEGLALKNGQQYGGVIFNAPVVNGTSGPYLILNLNSGGQIVLNYLLNPAPTGIKELGSIEPNNFSLAQNYPNPFNPETNINFSLVKSSNVKLVIYDILGRKITTLINKNMSPGNYSVTFNAEKFNLSSGTYIYTLQTEKFYGVKKMIYLK